MASLDLAPVLLQTETRGTTAVPFDVTLAAANTSEPLFTVPAGQRLRALTVANRSNGNNDAHVNLDGGGTAATTADTLLERRDSLDLDNLDFPEGDYEFIGGVGDTPRLTGVAIYGPPV